MKNSNFETNPEVAKLSWNRVVNGEISMAQFILTLEKVHDCQILGIDKALKPQTFGVIISPCGRTKPKYLLGCLFPDTNPRHKSLLIEIINLHTRKEI